MTVYRRIHSSSTQRGMSAPELLVVIGILASVFALSFFSFTRISDYNSADKHAAVVQTFVERARQHSLNSRNNSQYGVRFASSSVSIFEGTVYSSNAEIAKLATPPGVELQAVTLTGSASSVVFAKISGEPSATGTIMYRSPRTSSTTKTITIYGTGHSEVQ